MPAEVRLSSLPPPAVPVPGRPPHPGPPLHRAGAERPGQHPQLSPLPPVPRRPHLPGLASPRGVTALQQEARRFAGRSPNSMPPPEAAPPPSTSSSTAPLATSPRTPPCGGRPATSPARTWTDPWKSCSGGVFPAGKDPSPAGPTQADDPESITGQGRRPEAAATAVAQPLVRRQRQPSGNQPLETGSPPGAASPATAPEHQKRRNAPLHQQPDAPALAEIINEATRAGAITHQQAHDLEATDPVLRGTGPDNLTVHAVTRVSSTVRNEDIT